MSTTAAPSTVSSSPAPAVDVHVVGDRLPAKSPPNPLSASTTSSSPAPLRNTLPALDTSTKLARNVSPGLLARMKFLNQNNGANNKNAVDIGRIDDDKIRKLDDFHKDRSWSVDRRGAAWSGLSNQPDTPELPSPATEAVPQEIGRVDDSKFRGHRPRQSIDINGKIGPDIGRIDADKLRRLDDSHRDLSLNIERRGTAWSGVSRQVDTPLMPQSTGESMPTLVMEPDSASDHSSVVSTSDKVLPSESEADADDVMDMQKYRLPDITKTKSLTHSVTQTEAGTDSQPIRTPTPPPKDTPLAEPVEEASVLDDHNGIDIEAYFARRHYPRANSIYTLSKASFTNQIQQLTSMQLPPTTIASEITALPSSTLAGRALHKAANDIRLWIAKTKEVLNGLDAEDDVEWAAAAGREGLAEVDTAIGKFEGLVTVYISAIEDLQSRSDIALLPARDQATLISQMEDIVSNWSQIKHTLNGIKNQVEIAMEWEELWNNVLGEIGFEVENLSRLVFEMEERRHRVISDSVAEAPEKFDIAELETIVEEMPRQQAKMQNHRFSMPPTLSVLSPISPIPQIEQENSRLLALFAKLQPLRASLDFLPMRLASFQGRAKSIFPSACDELNRRKEQLEEQEKRLEAEADALREELGEDKWVHSFRQAGSKAVAMYDSCMKSIQRLTQAIEDNDEEKLAARIATYKDKKDHYPPSMRRVLELIDIEMKHRSTVNGEILRIQQDVRTKVVDLEAVTKDMDAVLEDFTASRKLRDSVSTVLSARTEASFSQSALDTPNSSPASSVVMGRKSSDHSAITPAGRKSRQSGLNTSRAPLSDNRRYSNIPLGPSGPSYSVPRAAFSRLDMTPSRAMTSTPTRMSHSPASERPAIKPRWNSSTKMGDTVTGHNFKPLSLTTPSSHRKDLRTPDRSLRTPSSQSAIPIKSPLSRSSALSPPPARTGSTTPAQSRRPLASPMQSPATPAKGKVGMRSTPGSSTQLSGGTSASRRRSVLIPEDEGERALNEESPAARRTTRPPGALNSRRSSLLPTPKQRSSSASSLANLTPATTPDRTSSRLGGIEESGRASRVSGRQSSLGEKSRWR